MKSNQLEILDMKSCWKKQKKLILQNSEMDSAELICEL